MKMKSTQAELVYRVETAPGEDYVTMIWKGYATESQFRQGTERMLEELVTRGKNKVLGDIREMVLISQEGQDWLISEFLPRAVTSGMRCVALVRPSYYFNKVAVETVAYKVNDERLRIQFFDDIGDARVWLNTQCGS
jgi:hypothetical protein